MESNHIEVPLHHHRSVVLADGVGSPLKTKEMLALLKHLRLRRVEIFGLGAAKLRPPKPITRP